MASWIQKSTRYMIRLQPHSINPHLHCTLHIFHSVHAHHARNTCIPHTNYKWTVCSQLSALTKRDGWRRAQTKQSSIHIHTAHSQTSLRIHLQLKCDSFTILHSSDMNIDRWCEQKFTVEGNLRCFFAANFFVSYSFRCGLDDFAWFAVWQRLLNRKIPVASINDIHMISL